MAKIIEPPILISRILMFMLATSIVVLAVLVFSLIKLIPLERPEVFFLLSPTRSVNTVIEPLIPEKNNPRALANYKQGFVREYVIARNTLYKEASLTRRNWANVVKSWSSDSVYSAFTKTALYSDYMDYASGDQPPALSCSVNFSGTSQEQAINDTTPRYSDYNEYVVNFVWICKNSGRQTVQKNYMIRIKIDSVLDKRPENLNKLLSNPLGTRVIEYKVLSVDGNTSDHSDPLDSDKGFL